MNRILSSLRPRSRVISRTSFAPRAFVHVTWTKVVDERRLFYPARRHIHPRESENAINIFVEMPGDALRGEEKREIGGRERGNVEKEMKKEEKREK